MNWKFTTLVIIIAAALVPPASAQWAGRGRMLGTISDPEGNPVKGAKVTVVHADSGKGPKSATTNEKGEWKVGGLAFGSWNIDVAAEGFVTRAIVVQFTAGNATKRVDIPLEVAKPLGPPPELLENLTAGDDAYQDGRYAVAREFYIAAMELWKGLEDNLPTPADLAEIHMQIARCYSQEENYEKELEHLDEVLAVSPDNMEIRSLMAQEALKGGLTERGLELLEGVDDSTITDPAFFFNVAAILLNQGKSSEAIPYLTKSIAADPTFAEAHFQRALAYFGVQDYDNAKLDCEKVIELDPDSQQGETAKRLIEAIGQQVKPESEAQ